MSFQEAPRREAKRRNSSKRVVAESAIVKLPDGVAKDACGIHIFSAD